MIGRKRKSVAEEKEEEAGLQDVSLISMRMLVKRFLAMMPMSGGFLPRSGNLKRLEKRDAVSFLDACVGQDMPKHNWRDSAEAYIARIFQCARETETGTGTGAVTNEVSEKDVEDCFYFSDRCIVRWDKLEQLGEWGRKRDKRYRN